ncbi:hypothetical protein BD309DRAFT_957541, partial [Dichomitus squalens]
MYYGWIALTRSQILESSPGVLTRAAAQFLRTRDAGRTQSSFDGCDGLAEPAAGGKVQSTPS